MRVSTLACAVLLVPGVLASCAPKVLTPKRPPGVPAAALWADGTDGGKWVDCHKVPGASPRFDCTLFVMRSGALYAKGVFVPDFDPARVPLRFSAYDGGGTITLSDTTHLRAEGLLDFPSGDGHGRVLRFRAGAPAGRDSTY